MHEELFSLHAETHAVPQPDEPGLKLHLRERRPAGLPPGAAVSAVLFVHGATIASSLWDIPVEDMSFMAAVARSGLPAYALDIRGYGRSRSLVMEAQSHPYAPASDAIKDIDRVVDFIREREGIERPLLIGGSWGSITTGLYAATAGRRKVARMVLFAPIFSGTNAEWLELIADPADPKQPNPLLLGYRRVSVEETRDRWDREIPFADKSVWRDETVFRALMQDTLDADPTAGTTDPPSFRVPNGTLLDLFEAFNRRPLYNPRAIEVPALLIRGANDPTSTRADATRLFDLLASPVKRYIEIGNGAHFVTAERNAWQVFQETIAFLRG